MLKAVFTALRFMILILCGHQQIALENATLRHQLAILKREQPHPKLRHCDRLFWIFLMKIWKQWRTALVIVQPATVVTWQRRRFKQYWWKLSQRKSPGRPSVSAEVRQLVQTMAAANITWGAPRIHGELLKLGFDISGAYRLTLDAEAEHATVSNVEDVFDQPCRSAGLDRL